MIMARQCCPRCETILVPCCLGCGYRPRVSYLGSDTPRRALRRLLLAVLIGVRVAAALRGCTNAVLRRPAAWQAVRGLPLELQEHILKAAEVLPATRRVRRVVLNARELSQTELIDAMAALGGRR